MIDERLLSFLIEEMDDRGWVEIFGDYPRHQLLKKFLQEKINEWEEMMKKK